MCTVECLHCDIRLVRCGRQGRVNLCWVQSVKEAILDLEEAKLELDQCLPVIPQGSEQITSFIILIVRCLVKVLPMA